MNEEIFFISIASIYCLFNLITIIFSLIILLTIIFNWRTHFRSVPNLLVCNSSVVFILYTISCFIQIPSMISNNKLNSPFCQLTAFLTICTGATQIFTCLAQAIFRYFSTILYRRKILLTFRVNTIIMVLGWIIPFIVTGSMLASPFAYQYEPESRICFLTTKYFLTSALTGLIVFFIPLSAIILLYGLILWNITHYIQFQSNANNIIRYKRNLKVFHNILLSVAIILVCGTPFVLSVIINVIGKTPWIFYLIIILSISISVSLQSVVLFFTTDKLKQIFCEKIGYYHTEVRRIQLRRTNQVLPTVG